MHPDMRAPDEEVAVAGPAAPPVAGPARALVRLEAASLPRPAPAAPLTCVVGVLERLGPAGWPGAPVRPGQRVAALVGADGWADRLLVAPTGLVPVPDGVGAGEVAAVAL